MGRSRQSFAESVFVNCPFDDDYLPIFEAVVFTIVAAGFHPRCAVEQLDSGTVRVGKIQDLIRQSQYGIHDLSRVELSQPSNLPRFNMPFELGLDLAAKFFGTGSLKNKQFLVLDSVPYRFQQYISDISGQDIHCHHGNPGRAIEIVRNWLRATSGRGNIPGPARITRLHPRFVDWLPRYCTEEGFDRHNLAYLDFVSMARYWITRGAAESGPIEKARLDPLTELPGRPHIHAALAISISPYRAPQSGDALLLIDLDRLDSINQRYGHLTGDRLLLETARILKRIAGQDNEVGRYGGDEFVVIARSDSPEATATLAESMKDAIAANRVLAWKGSRAGLTASVGVAFLSDTRLDSVDAILVAADAALAGAKREGGNRVVFHDEDSSGSA